MKFLLKLAFWLTIVVLLLPSGRSHQGAAVQQVGTSEAASAANAAYSDMRQFCVRQPEACEVGSHVLVEFGHKAQAGARMLYEFLNEKLGHEPGRENTGSLAGAGDKPIGASARKPSQNTLTPADLVLPWRGPQSRQEAQAKRPA